MKGADLHGRAQEPGCGHSLDIWLKLDGERIAVSSFVTDGCERFVFCGSMVAHLCLGKTLAEARGMTVSAVLEALGEDDEPSRYSVELALAALRSSAPVLIPTAAPDPRP